MRNGIHFWNAYSKTVGNLSIHSANFGHYYDLASTLISLWSFSMGNTLSYRVFVFVGGLPFELYMCSSGIYVTQKISSYFYMP